MAKTKTITVKKHQRILKALGGHEQNNPDSSKFRFWVKAKGKIHSRKCAACGRSHSTICTYSNQFDWKFINVKFCLSLSLSLAAHGKGFTIEKPANFKEVPVFEQQHHDLLISGAESSGSGGGGDDDIATHLYVPNLTKVSIVRITIL